MLDHHHYIREMSKYKNAMPLSFTKGNNLLSCPFKFKCQYLDKADKTDPPHLHVLLIGRFIHKVLESCTVRGKMRGWAPEAIDFDTVWDATSKQIRLAPDVYAQVESLREHTKNIMARVAAAIKSFGLQVVAEMNICMDQKGNIRTASRYLERFFFGFIDMYGETAARDRALVLDYKSGRKSDDGDARTNKQLEAYVHYLFVRNPKLKTVQYGGVYIPDEDICLGPQVLRDSAEHQAITQGVKDFYDQYLAALSTTDFSAVPGFHCNWCDYTHSCSSYQS